MKEKPTNELEAELKALKPGQLDTYFKENSAYLTDSGKNFYYYFKDTLDKKNIFLKDVYSFAGVSESYGSKIISLEKHTRNRDLILRLCIAGHFTVDEINRALKLYKMSPLYAKDRRDACLIVAVNNRIYNIDKLDELLESGGYKKLSADVCFS